LITMVLGKLKSAVVPSVWTAWRANRTQTVPGYDLAANATRLDEVKQQHAVSLANLGPHERELLVLSVAHERERIATLEGRAFAVAALPSAVAAAAALIIGHDLTPTLLAIVSLLYAGCALWSAALVLRPRPREVFGITDAIAPDGLVRLVAATRINQQIGTLTGNRVAAAVQDSARAAFIVVVAAVTLGIATADRAQPKVCDDVTHCAPSPAVSTVGPQHIRSSPAITGRR
jgi:hypothetical protein